MTRLIALGLLLVVLGGVISALADGIGGGIGITNGVKNSIGGQNGIGGLGGGGGGGGGSTQNALIIGIP